MKTIVGRVADLSLGELLRLLTTASAAGELSLRNSAGETRLRIAAGMVEGEVSPVTLLAFQRREGSFSFRPAEVEAQTHWQPVEEFLLRLAQEQLPAEPQGEDALSQLRESLLEVSPPARSKVLVVTADPRPYKSLEVEWAKRGWEVTLEATPQWPQDQAFHAAVFHLPGSATLAGQGDLWLQLLTQAGQAQPPVPVVWVGGLTDAWLRHEAIQRGAAFLLPAPAGEVGEAARWFREDLTSLLERLLQRRPAPPAGAAFQEFFLALHADTTPEEARASLLRLTASAFSRGVLFACGQRDFALLGGFGCAPLPRSLPRGIDLLEQVVAQSRPLEEVPTEEAALAFLSRPEGTVSLFPLRVRGEVRGLLATSGKKAGADVQELMAVAGSVGPLLGL